MITLSPCCQLTGVATLCFAVSCSESITRRTSSKLRPVVIGYTRTSLTFLSGPMTNTLRTVWLSAGAVGRVAGHPGGQHAVHLGHVEVRVRDDRVVGRGALRLRDVLRPLLVLVGGVHGQADDLHVAPVELGLDLGHVA